jgi:hypothetical protein
MHDQATVDRRQPAEITASTLSAEALDESCERFDEAAPMIINALKTGLIEGDGKFRKQLRTEIRPRAAR